ncbi:MAG: peptidoglycan editing factor PgeF [Gemmatimonadetes bacterium]|nr:peptidoglycan editing factor PgeF [Gemmatimonadota bacterium]
MPEPSGWSLAAHSLNAAPTEIRRVTQVHGCTVHVWRRADPRRAIGARPEADAHVSDDPDLVLAVQVADCVPILLADPRCGVAAAVHAGWRGTAAGIARAAVETLTREFGSHPADVTAAVGPSIGPCCYEVGAELVSAFRTAGASDTDIARWFHPHEGAKRRLDLWRASRDQLTAAGVPAAQVFVASLCTRTHADVFDSYRAHGVRAGRMAGLVRPPPPA